MGRREERNDERRKKKVGGQTVIQVRTTATLVPYSSTRALRWLTPF
jgi:hypothetical protein